MKHDDIDVNMDSRPKKKMTNRDLSLLFVSIGVMVIIIAAFAIHNVIFPPPPTPPLTPLALIGIIAIILSIGLSVGWINHGPGFWLFKVER